MASDGEISCTNDPNFAVIYSFLKVFGKLYGLEIPSIEKLQQLLEDTEEVSEPLKELHLRLLRRALKSVQSSRWERCLVKFCHQRGHHQEAWEIERFSYKKASTEVKLKTLKLLLEYQFTCHAKFKAAVNALSCKDLRLDPLGRDKNGCVYWLQVDDEANLCLYKEDQDEETWQLIARNREELIKVIGQLKNGEEICPSTLSNTNEDSSSTEIATTKEKINAQADEENEEFLSPESESEHDDEESKADQKSNHLISENHKPEDNTNKNEENQMEESQKVKEGENNENATIVEKEIETENKKPLEEISDNVVNSEHHKSDEQAIIEEKETDDVKEELVKKEKERKLEPKESELPEKTESKEYKELCEEKDSDEVSEAIEEPIMVVTGEGSGADCESFYFIGEEISEPVMYIYGEGCGYDNDTGNPEVLDETNNDPKNSDEENGNEECVNGEHSINDISNSPIGKMVKSVKLKSGQPTVTKRLLKKQSNDNSEVLKSDSKKHCVRKPTRSNSLRSNSSSNENEMKREGSANDKNTDSESTQKKNVKKGRGKMRRRPDLARKLKLNETKESSPASDEECQNSKASIIEKRKNSVSSDLDAVDNTENEKEGSPDKETKVEDDLPPKKLRLESNAKEIEVSHSNETDTIDNIGKEEAKSENNENNDDLNTELEDKDPIAMRKKIKANKGKFKRKKVVHDKVEISKLDNGNDNLEEKEKNKSKPLKRSLLDATNSDKNKSESQSESEDDMPITSGKRLKIKPKKILTSSRKKVEAKLLEKKSSDDSEEETLHSIAGKKTGKKVLKKKPKGKEKDSQLDESDLTPVRQSRRIAQQKIREEADRRHLEEVALRELKMIHKKKGKDDEEEWRASGSSSESPVRAPRRAAWRAADSSAGSESESDDLSDRPQEPDLVFDKSDHEFSPESDLESGEPSEPLKRARTLQEGADDGFCKRCGSGEQPEWILLCDKCDAGYHASCLKPMLFLVPEGDWFCPPCNHELLITSLESELVKYDELLVTVEAERAKRKELEQQQEKLLPKENSEQKGDEESGSGSSSEESSGSSAGAVYRLRARRQLPVSYRAQEYDRLISSAIKEEYVEPTTSAGNQGRGKDISTIIEAAEEEKLKAEREEAIAQGKPIEIRKKKKQRRKPRKLNSLDVVSEDDDETDEDFKDTGVMESSSEEISSSAERGSTDSRSSDSLPIRRPCRTDKKDRPKLRESSPEVKKKKGEFAGSSSESSGAKEWPHKVKTKSKSRSKRDKSHIKKSRKKRGLTQYDAAGNVIRARVTYGGLSDDSPNDWSPKHRTRQKKINYTEMPNTESEDEMHKGSGKHMPDSSDEFKVEESEATSESEGERAKRARADDAEHQRALSDLIKTAVVPLEKLPDDVTRAKQEELQAHLNAQAAPGARARGRGRGGRGSRGGRGGRGARAAGAPDDALSKLVGVKIKDLGQEPMKPNQLEREKKRQEREAKLAEKEAKRVERIQKKEEKDKLKEQKAKEREEKRLARLALQENKRMKKEKPEYPMSAPVAYGARPPGPPYPDYPEHRLPATPRLQVRAELRGVPVAGPLAADQSMREGTLSVAGSPQPFKPASEEPSVITRMPHMLNHYRGPMMYSGGGPAGYGPRQGMMYVPHPGLPGRPQYSPYYGLRALPPYPRDAPPPRLPPPGSSHGPPGPLHGPPGSSHGPPGSSHGPPGSSHGPPGPLRGPQGPLHGPQGHLHGPQGPLHGPPGSSHGPPGSSHGPPGSSHGPPVSAHGPPGPMHGPPGSSQGPPGSSHGPPGPLHGPPGSSHGPPRSMHGPPGPAHGPPGSLHGPPGNLHGPPGSSHGLPGTMHGPPGSMHGPPRTAHGPPGSSHGPHGSPGPYGPSSLHGLLRAGPPVQLHGLRGPMRPPGSPGVPVGRPPGPHGPAPPNSVSPATLPPGPGSDPRSASTPPVPAPGAPHNDAPIKIKTEVKTEPEYHSPVQSPPRSSPEPPRHPKIKHTDNKERRPRYPLGPYAPQYGPYGPYAPPGTSGPEAPPGLLGLHARPPGAGPSPLQRMHHNLQQFLPPADKPEPARSPLRPDAPHYLPAQQHLRPHFGPPPARPRASPGAPPHYGPPYEPPEAPPREPERTPPPAPSDAPAPPPGPALPPRPAPGAPPEPEPPAAPDAALACVKTEPRTGEEGGVFGGLVSYFSSQHEDELDA